MDHNSEKAPFLPGDKEMETGLGYPAHGRRKPNWSFKAILFHASLVLLYTAAFVTTYFKGLRPQKLLDVQHVLPSMPVFPFQEQTFTILEGSPYSGPPTKPQQAAWDELLEDINIRVSPEELGPNRTSVELADGNQLAWLDVHHQLHCVKYLHTWTYRDYFDDPPTGAHRDRLVNHLDHCVELLRQVVMCRPDMTFMTFEWIDGQEKPSMKMESPPRTCVNWDEWTRQVKPKVIDGEEMDQLRNPNL